MIHIQIQQQGAAFDAASRTWQMASSSMSDQLNKLGVKVDMFTQQVP